MSKCLITKLNGTVSNNRLFKVGEMRVKIDKVALPNSHTQGLTFLFDEDVTLSIIGDGYFTDKTLSQNLGKTIKILANTTTYVYVSKDSNCEVSISNKYALVDIAGFGEYSLDVFSSDLSNHTFYIEQFAYCKKLKSISFLKSTIEGDISALQNLTALTSIDLSGSNASGDISALQNLTALTSINLSGSNVSGDISALQNLTALTSIDLSGSNVSGDISALQNLTALTSINLLGSNVSGDISALQNLTALTSIEIQNTSGDIGNLRLLTKLNILVLPNNTISGDLSLAPTSCYFISFNSYKGTGFNWGERPTSANIFGLEGNAIVNNIDKMLQDLSNCVKPIITNDKSWYRKIIAVGNKTDASNSAVQTLQNKGYTVSITPA